MIREERKMLHLPEQMIWGTATDPWDTTTHKKKWAKGHLLGGQPCQLKQFDMH